MSETNTRPSLLSAQFVALISSFALGPDARAETKVALAIRGGSTPVESMIRGTIEDVLGWMPGVALGASSTVSGSRQQILERAAGTFDLLLYALIDEEAQIASLELLDARSSAEPVARALVPTSPSECRARLREVVPEMLGAAGLVQGGRISASIQPEGAEFLVDDQPSERVVVVLAGSHRVEARMPGWVPEATDIVVRDREVTEVALELSEEGGFFASPWVWIAAGAAAAVVVAAIVIAPEQGQTVWCHARAQELCE